MGNQSLRSKEGDYPPARNSLIISKHARQALSKEQQTFNSRVKKIEKLQADLEKKTQSLQQKLDFYGKHIYPLEQRQIALHKELTRYLYKYFRQNGLFSKNEKAILSDVISMHLQNILQLDEREPDDEFKEIFKAVENIDYDEAAQAEIEEMKQEMQSLFASRGMDFNMDDMHQKMTEEEVMKKMQELESQLRQQAERNKRPPGKTKKQLAKEAKEKELEAARTKSIHSIYKQLVKIFHPDLEQDPVLKLEKEELMKKLTTSYKSGDLHTLLYLELQWIQKEGSNIDNLTDDKLALYNESLKHQIDDLQDEINELLHHPRYQPLYPFAGVPNQLPFISVKDIKAQKTALIRELMRSLSALRGHQNGALAELRGILHAFSSYR